MNGTRRSADTHGPYLPRKESDIAGRNIAVLRRRKGLTQGQLAAPAGMAAPQMSRIEGGRRRLRKGEVTGFAELLGVTPDVLLAGCANCGGNPPAGFTCQACGADRPAPGGAGGS